MIDFIDSWEIAEQTCFDKLHEYLGGDIGRQAFRGYMPEGAPDVWAFTSGGGETESQIGRLYGTTPCMGSIRTSAMVEAQYAQPERAKALKFGMTILKMLSDTGNMHEINNIQWLRLVNLPSEPVLTQSENGYFLWVVQVPLELIYATTTNYSDE